MMDVLRRAAKCWIAKVQISLLALSFVVWGIADVFTGFRASALATVGGQEISAQSYTQAFNQSLQNMSRQTGEPISAEEARTFGLDRQILNNLIQAAAIDAEGAGLKLAVSDESLAEDVAANPSFKGSDGKFSPELFRRLLEQNGLNEQMYIASERQVRLRAALTDAVDGDFTPPKTLVEALTRHRTEQRDARYFTVVVAESEIVAPTDEEIKKHYEGNPQSYTAPEYRSIAVIKAEPADVAAKLTLSDEELKAGYERLKLDYFTPERRTVLQMTFPSVEEAHKAKVRLGAGEDFLAIAKERGITEADATFADKTKADFFDPKVSEAAFSLAQGAVSDPIQGSLAISLIKAVSITPEVQRSLDEVKAELSERLKLDKAREDVQAVYDAVEDARAGQARFEDIARDQNLPFQLVPLTDINGRGRDGKDMDIPYKEDLLKAAFGSDVGVENDALTPGEGFVWYEVREVAPAAVEPLDKVKDRVRQLLVSVRLRDLAAEKAKKLVVRAEAGIALETLAQEAQATVKTATGLKRNETNADFDAAAVTAVFGVPERGFTFAIDGEGKSAKVIQPQAVLLPPYDSNSADAKDITETVQQGTADDVLALYLANLQDRLGVTINDSLWRQISGTQTP